MKLLIIVPQINEKTVGLVVVKFLKAFANSGVNIYIISGENTTSFKHENLYVINDLIPYRSRIVKLLITLTAKEWVTDKWVNIGFNLYKNHLASIKFDSIFSLTSACSFETFQLGSKISKLYNIPLWLHSVDALPSPPEWGENLHYRKGIIKCIMPFYKQATWVSATNASMLDYQLEVLKLSHIKPENKKILPNPGEKVDIEMPDESLQSPLRLLYLGSLYGKRNPFSVIKAFELFCKDEKNRLSELFFVGINSPDVVEYAKVNNIDNIKLIPWSNEPYSYINGNTILLDIDPDISNDVNVSSKLTKYLLINRLILCVTRNNSPSYKMLEVCKSSVFISSFEVEEILGQLQVISEAMSNKKLDFSDRQFLVQNLDPEFIVNEVISTVRQPETMLAL